MRQTSLFKKEKSDYGGSLRTTRAGRSGPRPIAIRTTMHLVLRSTQAKGAWSFRKAKNAYEIHRIISEFSKKYGIRVLSLANVGNHIHLHIKLGNRFGYAPFIRAITSAIVIRITGRSRWLRTADTDEEGISAKFWDYRPWTRIVQSYREYLNLSDYLQINRWEGDNYDRADAQILIRRARDVITEMQKFVRFKQELV